MSLQDLLWEIFDEYAGRTAVAADGPAVTYAVLRRRIDSISRSLLEWGCQPGWKIAYLRCAGHAYVELLFAAAQIGAVFCPLSPRTEPGLLLERLDALRPQVVVLDPDLLTALEEGRLQRLTHRIVVYPSAHRLLSYQGLTRKQLVLRRVEGEQEWPVLRLLDEDSGQAETVNYGQLHAYLSYCRHMLRHPPGTTLLCIPYTCLAYVQELCLGLACGDTVLPLGSFQAKDFIKLVSARQVDSVFLTPSIINAVHMDARFLIGNFSSLRRVRLGQAYLDQDTARQLKGLLSPECRLEKHTGFPQDYAVLSLPVEELNVDEWNAASAPLNAAGRPAPGWELRTEGAEPAGPGSPQPLLLRRTGEADWHPLDRRGWLDQDGLLHFSWEVEEHVLPPDAPFASLRTGASNRSGLGLDGPPLPLSSYLDVFDAFSHIPPARPSAEFCRRCCQVILEQFRCQAAALEIPRHSVQNSIRRNTIIQEVQRTTLSAGLPAGFWFRHGGDVLRREVREPDFPQGLSLVCHPIYSSGCQLIGELYLAFARDLALQAEGAARLCVALRYLAVLLASHRELMENATRMELYQHAIELAGDGIGISGLEAKPTLLFVNSKSARFINLGKSDPTFGALLNQTQTANLQDLRLGGKSSSSRSFFYTRPGHGKSWVNYRTEKVAVDGDDYAIAFCNMQESGSEARHLEGLLSQRELEIVDLVARGLTNKEISARVGVSVNTVKYHLSRIYEKMQVTSRAELLSSTYLRK